MRVATVGARYERQFFGNRNGLEARLVQTMPLVFVPSAPLRVRLSFGIIGALARNVAGIVVASRALRTFGPTMLVATGGYVCFPVVVAARLLCILGLLRCRIGLLEINARPGLTNRLLTPLVDDVWIAYADSARFFGAKAIVTGTPVRSTFIRPRPVEAARRALGLAVDRVTIVVMGGSQGARTINEAVATLLTQYSLPAGWQILHVSGERDFLATRVREKTPAAGNVVRLVPYLDDPADAYAAADIVIARAGASTLAELAVTATPSILVPYPFAADGHQAANAALFAAAGAAVVIADAELSAESLLSTLVKTLSTEAAATMRAAAATLAPADAARKIVDRITASPPARVVDSENPNAVSRD